MPACFRPSPPARFYRFNNRMALSRLRRMRLNEAARELISSLPRRSYSGASGFPKLTSLAIAEICNTGRIATICNSTFNSTAMMRNTTSNVPMVVKRLILGFGVLEWVSSDQGAEEHLTPFSSIVDELKEAEIDW